MITSFFKNAPKSLLGAFFLMASCDAREPLQIAQTTPEENPAVIEAPAFEEEVRFLAYNLKNYLTMTRRLRNGERSETTKPEEDKAALVEIIAAAKPHILGVCEIGTVEDLKELQNRLKSAGLDLPFSHHAGGVDPTRRLAILSAYPFQSINSQDKLSYSLGGKQYFMRRGLLDVTINLPFGPTHFIGTHFKSKREIEEADQELIRLNEAMLTRKHADALLASEPNSHLVVYGDFNDSKRNPAVKKLQAGYRAPNYLEDIRLRDSRGEYWTHFWNYQHQYSRFDYILFSRNLKPQMHFKKCAILDPPNWFKASDHRALLATFKSAPAEKTEKK